MDTDADMLERLPTHCQAMYPFLYSTAKVGLTTTAALLVDVLGAVPGLATDQIVGALNNVKLRSRIMGHKHRCETSKGLESANRGTITKVQASHMMLSRLGPWGLELEVFHFGDLAVLALWSG